MIEIKSNPNGDTRTAKKDVTFEEFKKANDMHRKDVAAAINFLSDRLKAKMYFNDRTKILAEKDFYCDFRNTLETGVDFTKSEWYQMHIREERHHPTSYLHEDFDLLDLIETICYCVCAGIARSGEVRPMEFDDKIVKIAVENTIKLLKNNICLKKD